MLIRLAGLEDLGACLALDADSQTDHVWQMEEHEEHGGVGIRFQTVRLPRVMRVSYPREREDLLSCWENGSTILVATPRPTVQPAEDLDGFVVDPEPVPILGYCQLDTCEWQRTGWIDHLIVDRQVRRQGIGAALLGASAAWARYKRLQQLMTAVQTKNYPGISFCQKHGFTFCGFNDHYFPNRDIALFFALNI